jgi:predicted DNA-binding transcriptional regulator YafY
MEFIKQIERLQQLNKLVREQRTGSPEELAKRIGVSRAKLYLMLDELRDEGVEIKFAKRLNSFFYENCAGISVVFSLKVLESTEIRNISAGKRLNYFPASIILDGSIISLGYDQSPRPMLATGS